MRPLCPSPCIFLVINGSFLFPESWTFTSVGCLVELAISALGGVPPRTGAVPWGGHSQAPTADAAGLGTFLPPDVQSTLGQAPAHPQTGEFSPQPHYRTDTQQGQAGIFCRCFLSISQDVTFGISAIGEVETRARLVAAEPLSSAPHPHL